MRESAQVGRFVLLRRLGEGGFGEVHEARDPKTNTLLALKRLTRLDADAIYRFKNEFRSLSGVSHPMAPEQVEGGELTTAADWYRVGTMLYEALVGELPFAGSAMQVLAQKHTLDPPDPRARTRQPLPDDLCDLAVRLLGRDASRRPDGAELAQFFGGEAASVAPARTGRSLVGRELELATLREALHASREGAPGVVFVSDPSGIGKSVLVDAFAAEALREGVVVLRGRCFELEQVPYKAPDLFGV